MCEHKELKIVELTETSIHKAKKLCANCDKFMCWHSLKSPEQKEQDRKQHIKLYYKLHPEKNKYKSIRNEKCLF